MPLYEFKCPKCETTQEKIQKYEDDPPKCLKMDCDGKTKRVVSVSNFHLKGLGWASDGYRR